MRNFISAGAVLAASFALVTAENCRNGGQQIKGNWYCSAVKAITYDNVGTPGHYMQVVDMDGGKCNKQKKEYSGPMSPMDEEVSLHFRGPMKLKQFAVYTPGSSQKKRSPSAAHQRRHGHQHFHEHQNEVREIQERAEIEAIQKRACGDIVTAPINGQMQTWTNSYGCETAPTSKPVIQQKNAATEAPAENAAAPTGAPAAGPADGKAQKNKAQKSGDANGQPDTATGDWVRQGYYDAVSGHLDGLSILSRPDYSENLQFVSADGLSTSASPQTLQDTTIPSNKELLFFTDKECQNGDCGFVRPGSEAFHGFGGSKKAFFMEFQMPDDGKAGNGPYTNDNMPAIWMLNAQIPHTAQYGECSCWKTGCGEFDIMEVLDPGNTRCKSTFHLNTPGGDSDYIERPTEAPMKLAVIFDGDAGTAHIQVLDDNTNFGTSFSNGQMNNYYNQEDDDKVSRFRLSS
ncbi:MAG: target of Sbf [Caeruleum heppii]|nr:MAG: target of Sbf [Caeruleum heppii]